MAFGAGYDVIIPYTYMRSLYLLQKVSTFTTLVMLLLLKACCFNSIYKAVLIVLSIFVKLYLVKTIEH